MEHNHTNKEQLHNYHTNQLSVEETNALLEHISQCTYCADLFAASFLEENRIISAPKNLKEGILVEVNNAKEHSSKRQLFFYSFRVCTAMCGALFLLFSSFWSNETISSPQKYSHTVSSSFLDNMNKSMNEITYQINDKMNTFMSDKNLYKNGGNNND